MTKLAITCLENRERVFVRHNLVLGGPTIIETVGFEDATLFDDPDIVEGIIRDFPLESPLFVIVDVSLGRSIESAEDKYKTFLSMTMERSGPDKKVRLNSSDKGFVTNSFDYEKYLFSMLWNNHFPEYSSMEYDIVYKMINTMHTDFSRSSFNDSAYPLYECIEMFLDHKKSGNPKSEHSDETTKVIFRKCIDDPGAGDVIAVFALEPFADRDCNVMSYMHTGQHSAASLAFIRENTVSTSSGCDASGCLESELVNLVGYDNLEVVVDLAALGYAPKCLYCGNKEEPIHFVCTSCGDGMCDSCYEADTDHDQHYHNPQESAETEPEALLFEDVFGGDYGCETCVSKVISMYSLTMD